MKIIKRIAGEVVGRSCIAGLLSIDCTIRNVLSSFPDLKSGEQLVCAYNQWGVAGIAKNV
jgi:hypothetical protein